jgi:hypothetical protein
VAFCVCKFTKERWEKKYNKITPRVRIEEKKLSFERLLLKCVVDSFCSVFPHLASRGFLLEK